MGYLDIHPVKEKVKKKRQPKKLHSFFKDNMPLPINAFVVAPKNSGKTTLLINIIKKFYDDMFDGGIFYVSPTIDSDRTLSAIRDEEDIRFIKEYNDDIIERIIDNIPDNPDKRRDTLIILDDLTAELRPGAKIFKEWLTLRHKDLSILGVSHKFNEFIPPIIRMKRSAFSIPRSCKCLTDVASPLFVNTSK